MKELEELAVDVSAWTPSEVFSRLILDAAIDAGKLSRVITVFAEDITKGSGETVKVRAFPSRSAQGPIADGNSLSEVDSTLSTYSITIEQYGDYAKLTDFSIFKAGDETKARLIRAMGNGLARKFDETIYEAISASGAASVVKETATADWTAPEYNLYDCIVECRAALKANGVNPDYIIIHPDFEGYFLKGTVEGVRGQVIKVENGNLSEIAGLKVIVTGVAIGYQPMGGLQVVIIDSSRAVGEAWGKRPTFYEQFIPESNTYKEVVWAYFGAARLDTKGIGHVYSEEVV